MFELDFEGMIGFEQGILDRENYVSGNRVLLACSQSRSSQESCCFSFFCNDPNFVGFCNS